MSVVPQYFIITERKAKPMLETFLNALKVNTFVIVLTIVLGFIVAKLIIAIADKAISKLRIEKTLLRFSGQ